MCSATYTAEDEDADSLAPPPSSASAHTFQFELTDEERLELERLEQRAWRYPCWL